MIWECSINQLLIKQKGFLACLKFFLVCFVYNVLFFIYFGEKQIVL